MRTQIPEINEDECVTSVYPNSQEDMLTYLPENDEPESPTSRYPRTNRMQTDFFSPESNIAMMALTTGGSDAPQTIQQALHS